MPKQTLDSLGLSKMKGLKRERRAAAADKKAARTAAGGGGGEPAAKRSRVTAVDADDE